MHEKIDFKGERSKVRAAVVEKLKYPLALAFVLGKIDARPASMTNIHVEASYVINENTLGLGNCVDNVQVSIQKLDIL